MTPLACDSLIESFTRAVLREHIQCFYTDAASRSRLSTEHSSARNKYNIRYINIAATAALCDTSATDFAEQSVFQYKFFFYFNSNIFNFDSLLSVPIF